MFSEVISNECFQYSEKNHAKWVEKNSKLQLEGKIEIKLVFCFPKLF